MHPAEGSQILVVAANQLNMRPRRLAQRLVTDAQVMTIRATARRHGALANNPAIDPPCWTPGNQGPQAFGCGISHSPSGTKIASLTQPHTTAEPVPLNADPLGCNFGQSI